jgi:hypothetical protein
VSAHLALHDRDDIRKGDYVTTQSYPVLTFGYPDSVVLRLQKV